MEEYFFQYYSQGDEVLLSDHEFLPLSPVVNGSAFVKYSSQSLQGFGSEVWANHEKNDGNHRNANKRMMEFWKKSWRSPVIGPVEVERERNHKHTINERLRREKQKQSFAELHRMLPLGTKGDKNSIVKTAAERIQELQRCREELKRRKIELELALAAANHDEKTLEESNIKLRVAHPSSGIDSMLEILKCLKSSGTKIKAIQSTFSSQEFSAVLQIEAKIGAAEVEKAVHKTLFEVEKKFRRPF